MLCRRKRGSNIEIKQPHAIGLKTADFLQDGIELYKPLSQDTKSSPVHWFHRNSCPNFRAQYRCGWCRHHFTRRANHIVGRHHSAVQMPTHIVGRSEMNIQALFYSPTRTKLPKGHGQFRHHRPWTPLEQSIWLCKREGIWTLQLTRVEQL